MKIRTNYNNDSLYCLYWKELIPIGERYIEVKEDYLGEEITKIYSYECLKMLIDEYMDMYDQEPDIFGDE